MSDGCPQGTHTQEQCWHPQTICPKALPSSAAQQCSAAPTVYFCWDITTCLPIHLAWELRPP